MYNLYIGQRPWIRFLGLCYYQVKEGLIMNKNDFAPTPPMGWNSYDYYDTTVNEEQVKANADYMAKNLKEYGWEYIVVATDWNRLPDPASFPSAVGGAGFKPLADHIHKLGLKFGIHIVYGLPRHTAQEHSQDYYDSLFKLYTSWGIDFIKCDDICRHDNSSCRLEIEMIYKAIKKCGRPMVLSLSPGPALLEEGWHYATHANMWRMSDDFQDDFKALKKMFWYCELWQTHVRKGCYPDCDRLPVGMIGKGLGEIRKSNFTLDEAKTMMTLWCLFGSPLMLGTEMTQLDEETLSLLTNRKILAMLTPDCVPHQICRDDSKAIWQADNNRKGENYVALFNLSEKTQTIDVSLQDLGYYTSSARLTDLWTGNMAASSRGKIAAKLKPHACVVYRVEF